MKSLIRTIVVGVVITSVATGYAFAAQAGAKEPTQSLIISGTTGVSGVVMKGLPGDPVTRADGTYTATVLRNWSGIVTPMKQGYNFDPPSRTYSIVTANEDNQDFAPQVLTFTISGATGVAGVSMQGLPEEPVTDKDGNYRATVEYGWSGIVMPAKKGYIFTPPSRSYASVTSDELDNYASEEKMLTISGTASVGGYPVQGVFVSANNGGRSDATNAQGRYSVKVPYGWTGTITLAKAGFAFDPPSMSYANVTTDYEDGKPKPPESTRPSSSRRRRTGYEPAVGTPGRGTVIVIPTTQVKVEEFQATAQDMRIMLHILQKELQGPQTIQGVFVDYGDFFSNSGRMLEAVYIQDYGVLFFVAVNFPLVLPGQPQDEQAETAKEHVDPIWQQAREEILLPQDSTGGFRSQAQPMRDQRTIEEMKTDLIKALKHASNIRHLKPDELVVITVTGQAGWVGQPTSPPMRMPTGRRTGQYGQGSGTGVYGDMYAEAGGSAGGAYSTGSFSGGYGGAGSFYGSGTWSRQSPEGLDPTASQPADVSMTIQAKKSDIDAFARNELDFEQLSKRIKTFTY